MFEIAIAYIGAYLGNKVLDHVGDDLGKAFDASLAKLYHWVKAKFAGDKGAEASLRVLEKIPEDDDQRVAVAANLQQALTGDQAAAHELQALIDEAKRATPPGVVIRCTVKVGDLYGSATGAQVSGPLPADIKVVGSGAADTVHQGGDLTGVRADFRAAPDRDSSPGSGTP